MPLPHEPRIVNQKNPYSPDRVAVPAQQDTSSPISPSTKMLRIWQYIAILFLAVGWILPPLLVAISIIADAWGLEVIDQAARSTATFSFRVLSLNLRFRFLPLLVPIMGFVGLFMLLSSTSYMYRWRPFRIWFLMTGVTAVLPIILIAFAVDAQPPGSSLAMAVTMFGACIGPVLVLGISVGILGLMMYLPAKWTSTGRS